jgi:glutamate N-acetyltransferase/amino-acid N-acetyltransferase
MFKIVELENGLENVQGFYCGATNVGMRPDKAQGDVAFIRSEVPCDISAVFTSNTFQAAPIQHFQEHPKDFKTDFVLINAKNANAMTGEKGIEDIETILSTLSEKQDVLNPVMSSTGVIGYRLPIDKITSAFDTLDFNAKHSDEAARAIMTTDSFKKEIAYKVELEDGTSFNIAAICKGAGMINPAMATMLCFVITDADVPKTDMDTLLTASTEQSFNRISVDGDTSTNDTVMLLSNKQSGNYNKEATENLMAYLDKISDPHREQRKKVGIIVLAYMLVMIGLTYAWKKKIWKNIH